MIGLRLVEIPSALFPECSIDGNMYARTYRRLFHEFNSEEAVKLYPNVVETLKTNTGNGSRESLSDADWLIDDFGKLLDIVSE